MTSYPFVLQPLPEFAEFLCSEGAMLPHEINQINQFWDDRLSAEAELEGGVLKNKELRKSSVIGINAGEQKDWIFDRMHSVIQEANRYYHFDLSGFYEPLQLAQYAVGDFFDWHLDFGAGASSNRKLSLSVQLSDPDSYEGGDLEFRINNTVVKAPRTQGMMIIFPSFIMHRVTEITKGTRRSIVGWVSGPAYR